MSNKRIPKRASEIQVSYHPRIKRSDRYQIRTSDDAYKVVMKIYQEGTIELQEIFYVLLMNRSNEIIGYKEISRGGVSGTLVDSKLVFSVALKSIASSIFLVHNHPSGNIKPSQADIDLTRKLKAGAKLLDMTILDHLIVTKAGYYSFCDEGMMGFL